MPTSSEPVAPTQQDPAAALMREVGVQLRQVREERREDLDTVAETLRIKAVYLEGIERGDLSVMPGRAYALGFLRSYADYLGFDGDDLIEQIRSIVEDLTDRTRLEMKTPLHESRVPKAPVIALSVAMLAGVYVGWTFLQGSEEPAGELVTEVPENLKSIAVGALPEPRPSEDTEVPPPPTAEDDSAVHREPAGGEAEPARLSLADGVDVATTDPSPAEDIPVAPPADATPAIEPPPSTGEALPADTGTETPTRAQPALDNPASAPRQRAGTIGRTPQDTPDADRALAEVAPQAGPEPAAGPITPEDAAPLATRGQASPSEPEPPAPVAEPAPAVPLPPTPEAGDAPAELVPGPTEELTEPANDGQLLREAAPIEALPAVAPTTPATAAEVVAQLQRDSTGVAARSPDAGPPVVMEQVNQDARVVLRALETSWIRIASESGDYLRSRTLEPGDVFLVPNRDDLELWTGNAGGLELVVDGERIPPLGAAGTIVRDISLAPAALRTPEGPAGG